MSPTIFLATTYLGHFAQATVQCDTNVTCNTGLPMVAASSDSVHAILQIVFGVVGALAVLIIVIAGFQFVTAQGDPQAVAKARMAIIYAAIGLLIALSAEAIVTFVLGRL